MLSTDYLSFLLLLGFLCDEIHTDDMLDSFCEDLCRSSQSNDYTSPVAVKCPSFIGMELVEISSSKLIYCCGENHTSTTWYLDDEKLDSNPDKYSLFDNEQALNIITFSLKDEGTYTCVLENENYNASHSVLECADPSKNDQSNDISSIETSDEIVHFTDSTETLTLFCKAWAGLKKYSPVIEWRYNHSITPLLAESESYYTTQTEWMSSCDETNDDKINCDHTNACLDMIDLNDTIFSTLTIDMSTVDIEGYYTCNISNDAYSKSYTFTVLYAEDDVTIEVLVLVVKVLIPVIIFLIILCVACWFFRFEIALHYWKRCVNPMEPGKAILKDIYLISSPCDEVVSQLLIPWFNKWRYTVYFPERDDSATQSKLQNIINGINVSYWMVIVLSNAFLNDTWANFASIDAINHTDIENTVQHKKIVCLRLQNFHIPPDSTTLTQQELKNQEKLKNILKVYPIIDLPDKPCWMRRIKKKLLYNLPKLSERGIYASKKTSEYYPLSQVLT